MKDTTIPSLTSSNDGVPITIVIPQTQAQLLDQGYFYDGKSPVATNDSALQFDGSQNYVLVKNGRIISGLTNWYIALSFRISQAIINPSGEAMYAERAGAGNDIVKVEIYGGVNTGQVGLTYRDDAGTLTFVRTSATYNDGNIHAISVTKTGSSISINVDGTITTGTIAGTNNFTDAGVESRIAADKGDGASLFNGTIDNVQVGSSSSSLLGYWKFDEGSGITTTDSSGNGNIGTLIGTPLPSWVTGFSGAYSDSGNFTYNQVGVDYGGIYNMDESAIPALQTAFLEHPSLQFVLDSLDLTISNTQALLLDQGYTYDQAGFSYDQAGVEYAGVYNQNQDTMPLSLSFSDIYQPFIPTPSLGGFSVGPGFFMFITH